MRTLAQIAKEDKVISKLFFTNPLRTHKEPRLLKTKRKPISYIKKTKKKVIGEV